MIHNDGSIKQYIAILTQSGTNNPVATVLLNTLGSNMTWVRQSTGLYRHSGMEQIFLENKTHLIICPNFDIFGASMFRAGDVTIDYSMYDNTWNPTDDGIVYMEIKIFQ